MSVLVDKISPGDRIIAIDREDVSLRTASEISEFIVRKSTLEWKLTVVTPSYDQQYRLTNSSTKAKKKKKKRAAGAEQNTTTGQKRDEQGARPQVDSGEERGRPNRRQKAKAKDK
jgi:hypothetical protein